MLHRDHTEECVGGEAGRAVRGCCMIAMGVCWPDPGPRAGHWEEVDTQRILEDQFKRTEVWCQNSRAVPTFLFPRMSYIWVPLTKWRGRGEEQVWRKRQVYVGACFIGAACGKPLQVSSEKNEGEVWPKVEAMSHHQYTWCSVSSGGRSEWVRSRRARPRALMLFFEGKRNSSHKLRPFRTIYFLFS